MTELQSQKRPIRILVIQLQGLGDLVLSLPLLQFLNDTQPQARLTVLVPSGRTPALAALSGVSVLQISSFVLLNTVDMAEFDVVIDLNIDVAHPEFRVQMHRLPPSAIGFKYNNGIEDLPGRRQQVRQRYPIWRQYLELGAQIAASDGSETTWRPRLPLLRTNKALVPGERSATPLVALITGASNPSRIWPAESYSRLAQTITEAGAELLVVAEARNLPALTAECNARVVDPAQESLSVVLAALDQADLAIGNDTGLLHCAAALGRSVVGLYGPSDAIKYGPLGHGNTVVWAPTSKGVAIPVEEVLWVCRMMRPRITGQASLEGWSQRNRLLMLEP